MRRGTPLILAGLCLLIAAVAYWLWAGETPAPLEPATVTPATEPDSSPSEPAATARPSQGRQPARAVLPEPRRQAEPEGTLRLEGQVLDGGDLPVADARVAIDTEPQRITRSGRDGSFHFDRLIGRRYRLTARKAERVGGPLQHQLSAESDPVILRLRLGAVLAVQVVAAGSGEPVAGAVVELRGDQRLVTSSGPDGRARFEGVAGGGAVLHAAAAGHAPARQLVAVPDGAVDEPVQVRIALERGAAVRGRVVDSDGAPVAGARVVAVDTGALLDLQDAEHDGAASDAEGHFELPAVAAGTYRAVATAAGHPRSSSEPFTSDGQRPVTGVEVVLAQGGTIAGRVVGRGGRPAAWARVRVEPAGDAIRPGVLGGMGRRAATADAEGAFRIEGLKRTELDVLAVGERASSEPLRVDLRASPTAEDLELRLVVDGRIAGRVVDGRGRPVAEVTVSAAADIWAQGLDSAASLRGRASDLTDGGGNFALEGLPEGRYRLRASRSAGAFVHHFRPGVAARTGDEDVELVLEREGGLRGRVVFAGGGSPQRFSVAVGGPPGVPFASPDGGFELPEVPPGEYTVRVHGDAFADVDLEGVEVQAEQVTDLGSIEVQPGRTIAGRVVDGRGEPVAEASVMVAKRLIGDGSRAATELGAAAAQQMGLRRTISGPDGRFRIGGIDDQSQIAVAEHEQLGRSLPVQVPAGQASPELELVIEGFASLSGRISSGGQPAAGALVSASATGQAEQAVVVHAGDDGRYRIDKLPAGEHRVSANLVDKTSLGGRGEARMITLRAGEQQQLDIDIPKGQVELTVQVRGVEGAPIDSAQIFLIPGQVDLSVAAELNQLAASSGGSLISGFWLPQKAAVLADLEPGAYSLCVIPINGSMNDPAFLTKLQKHRHSLQVHCQPLEIAASPTEQSHTAVVPPMAPFPEDPPPADGGSAAP